MGEEHADGDAGPLGVANQVGGSGAVGFVGVEGLGEELGDWDIEREVELRQVGGEDAFGDGGGPGGGLGRHGEVGSFLAQAVGEAPDELALVQDSDLGAGDVGGG